MILKFLRADKGTLDGLEQIHFEKGKTYVVPDDMASAFVMRGSAAEVIGTIEIGRRSMLVGTLIQIEKVRVAEQQAKPEKKGFLQKLFCR